MKSAYLVDLKFFDSKDAQYPLDFYEVQKKKRAIFIEFLNLDVQELFARNLFGDLVLPEQILQILSLVPAHKKLRLKEENVALERLLLPANISVWNAEEFECDEFSSNPVEVEQPVFCVEENGEFIFIKSTTKGCKPVCVEKFSVLQEGQLLYTLEPVREDRLEEFAQLQFHVLNSYRSPRNDLERVLFEKVPEHLRAILAETLDLQG